VPWKIRQSDGYRSQSQRKLGQHLFGEAPFKPRTSPLFLSGLGEGGPEISADARKKTGLPVCYRDHDPRDMEILVKIRGYYTDSTRICEFQITPRSRYLLETGSLFETGFLSGNHQRMAYGAEYISPEGIKRDPFVSVESEHSKLQHEIPLI